MTVELPRNKNGYIVPRSFKLPFAPLEAQMKARGMSLMDMMEALGSDMRQQISEFKKTDEYKMVIKDKTQKYVEKDGMSYVKARQKAIKNTQIPIWDNTLRSTWRYREQGLNTYHADHWAVALGLHPVQIWPEWYEIPDEVFIQQDPTAMELRREIRKNKQNHRDRVNYDKRADTIRRREQRGQRSREEYLAEMKAKRAAAHEERIKNAYKVVVNSRGDVRAYTEEQWKKKLERDKISNKKWRDKKRAERLASQHTTD